MERRYFEISGYWKDDHTDFEGYIVTNYDDVDESEDARFSEEEIFAFGWDERDLELSVEEGTSSIEDYVITEYNEI